jgi:hypothetical protein
MKLAFLLLWLLQVPQEQPSSIAGYVLKIGTGEPVTRARVVLIKQPAQAGDLISTLTDGAGKFNFGNLVSGEYRIVSHRSGYLRTEYGQRAAEKPGVTITLAPRQELKDIVVSMIPTGVISGRVTDRYGEPVVNASVQAHKYTYREGRRLLGSFQSTRTNDIGEYRLYWLPPGHYVVSAVPTEMVRYDSGSVLVEGPGSPIRLNGGIPGAPMRIGGAVAAGMGLIDPTELGEGYLPVYFPGSTDPATAAPIDLRPGASFGGVDFITVETRAVRIRGTVLNSLTGQPTTSIAALVPRHSGIAGSMNLRGNVNPRTGAFEFRGITPGSYDLVATTNTPPAPPPPGSTAPMPPPPTRFMTARTQIEVGSADIENIILMLHPGFTVNGRITIEGRDPNQNQPEIPRIGVELRSDVQVPGLSLVRTPARPDGTFTIQGAPPGGLRLFLSGTPPNSYVKAAQIGGIDVLSNGLQLEDQPSVPLEVLLSTKAGTIEAIVLDDQRKIVSAVTVALVPEIMRRGQYDQYRSGTTDANGRIRLERIVPGDYKLFAWEEVEANAWQDADFIRTFEERGTTVRIVEGANERIELKVIVR